MKWRLPCDVGWSRSCDTVAMVFFCLKQSGVVDIPFYLRYWFFLACSKYLPVRHGTNKIYFCPWIIMLHRKRAYWNLFVQLEHSSTFSLVWFCMCSFNISLDWNPIWHMLQLLEQVFMVFSYVYLTVGSQIHIIRNQIRLCCVPSTYRNCTLRSKSWNLCTSILRNPRSFHPKLDRMEYFFSQCWYDEL